MNEVEKPAGSPRRLHLSKPGKGMIVLSALAAWLICATAAVRHGGADECSAQSASNSHREMRASASPIDSRAMAVS